MSTVEVISVLVHFLLHKLISYNYDVELLAVQLSINAFDISANSPHLLWSYTLTCSAPIKSVDHRLADVDSEDLFRVRFEFPGRKTFGSSFRSRHQENSNKCQYVHTCAAREVKDMRPLFAEIILLQECSSDGTGDLRIEWPRVVRIGKLSGKVVIYVPMLMSVFVKYLGVAGLHP